MKDKIERLLLTTGDMALRRRARWLLTNLDLRPGEKVLDVGCGDGYYLHLLANLGINLKITGVDNNQEALASARRNIKRKKVKLIEGDTLKLPFRGNTFDKIIASEVLEHLPNDQVGINELHRVLKKGGKIVISVPHKNYPFLWDPINWILERFLNYHIKNGFWAGIWNQHERLYSEVALKFLLKKEGFKDIKTEILTSICLPFNHYLINIFARILADNRSLRSTYLSKFTEKKGKSQITPFLLLFHFDKLNDIFKSDRVGVSLVLSAIK